MFFLKKKIQKKKNYLPPLRTDEQRYAVSALLHQNPRLPSGKVGVVITGNGEKGNRNKVSIWFFFLKKKNIKKKKLLTSVTERRTDDLTKRKGSYEGKRR